MIYPITGRVDNMEACEIIKIINDTLLELEYIESSCAVDNKPKKASKYKTYADAVRMVRDKIEWSAKNKAD